MPIWKSAAATVPGIGISGLLVKEERVDHALGVRRRRRILREQAVHVVAPVSDHDVAVGGAEAETELAEAVGPAGVRSEQVAHPLA